jgi:rhamnogalacturonan hydrolase
MIKSNGGSGTVSNCSFNNFIGHSNAYSLYLNSYWSSMSVVVGSGILYSDLTFSNWKGTAANGVNRAPISVLCPDTMPCERITISGFAMWTDAGSSILEKCQSAWGTGGCLKAGTPKSYATTTSTIKTAP